MLTGKWFDVADRAIVATTIFPFVAAASTAAVTSASAAAAGPTNLRKQFVSADRKIATIYRVNKVKHFWVEYFQAGGPE